VNRFESLLRSLAGEGVEFVIIGGVAAYHHGSARVTLDLDIVYGRSAQNIGRLVRALAPLHPYLRGAPLGLPFRFDEMTVQRGLNFTLTTDAGPLDCLGEVAGIGRYDAVSPRSHDAELFGIHCRFIDLDALIETKRAAGRLKDLDVIAELEAIREEREK
jgi:predicted nucleotidyltransferase